MKRDDLIGNMGRDAVFSRNYRLAKLGKPVDEKEWGMTPPTVNAYYSPSMNDINFPAGILQPSFYDPSQDDAVNYGHIGAVIGHELTHGFDDEGKKFDGKGNLSDWWTADDTKKFVSRTDCIVNEYGNFVAVDDVKVNGKLTLGENTADNGGLHGAVGQSIDDTPRRLLLDRKAGAASAACKSGTYVSSPSALRTGTRSCFRCRPLGRSRFSRPKASARRWTPSSRPASGAHHSHASGSSGVARCDGPCRPARVP